MKLGEAMYKAQQAEAQPAGEGAETGEGETAEEQKPDEEVVDAEFSEVDDENKSA
jgi:molecular chaperone DnaK